MFHNPLWRQHEDGRNYLQPDAVGAPFLPASRDASRLLPCPAPSGVGSFFKGLV